MSKAKRILVKSAAGNYAVVCGNGMLSRLLKETAKAGRFSSHHVLTSLKVWKAVGRAMPRGSGKQPLRAHEFNDAETAKNLQTVEEVTRSLVKAGADRHAVVIAVGGGVVGDVAGFAAASYLRGVALVQVPTTLVAQTDSAIGGKTGVNLPEGKNLVGAFYPPKLVVVDPRLLATLPEREYRGGLAEVIKYGVIADAKLFAFLEKNFEKVLARDARALEYLITRSVEIKAAVVSKDERESGLREILNFGHTFGHALESVTGYRRYQHGEAVAWGMMAAALYGHEIGVTPAADASRIIALVRRMGKLPAWPSAAPRKLIELMMSDKKTRAGKLRFVLSPRIGKAATYQARDLHKLELVLRVVEKAAEAGATPGEFHG
ncbi:MAG TPA: 3-dehydroquinate synthase [Candidatus Acidoferrum sp.]|nr:3-dehydroquinate synthase [Candidatus Acidoferrum sp.]